MIPSGYTEFDFGTDFRQKWQISILCYSLKMGMNYQIKHFEGPILDLHGFFSSFRHNPFFLNVSNLKSGAFKIFVKK